MPGVSGGIGPIVLLESPLQRAQPDPPKREMIFAKVVLCGGFDACGSGGMSSLEEE